MLRKLALGSIENTLAQMPGENNTWEHQSWLKHHHIVQVNHLREGIVISHSIEPRQHPDDNFLVQIAVDKARSMRIRMDGDGISDISHHRNKAYLEGFELKRDRKRFEGSTQKLPVRHLGRIALDLKRASRIIRLGSR